MSDGPIAFLDSGVGGIPYLLESRRLLPGERFVYYADNQHFPYGERTADELRRIVASAVETLLGYADPRLIVVACNTASVVALHHLRDTFPTPFVGVVPAIKPAAEHVGGGRIGVLATSRTVEDVYVSALIRRYAPTNEVVLVAAGGLVQMVEQRLGSVEPDELDAALTGPVNKLKAGGVDAVVLGCTHFIHVRERIQALLGPGIRVIDSVAGVARQTARLAGACGCEPGSTAQPGPAPEAQAGTRLLVSDSERAGASYRYLAARHGLVLEGIHARYRDHG